jgi:hypothetical protein
MSEVTTINFGFRIRRRMHCHYTVPLVHGTRIVSFRFSILPPGARALKSSFVSPPREPLGSIDASSHAATDDTTDAEHVRNSQASCTQAELDPSPVSIIISSISS